jgi:hypothetical protein
MKGGGKGKQQQHTAVEKERGKTTTTTWRRTRRRMSGWIFKKPKRNFGFSIPVLVLSKYSDRL